MRQPKEIIEQIIGRFRRPRYCIGWDLGEDRDYWVKTRMHRDGTIEIVDQGCNEHKTANAEPEPRRACEP